MEGLKKIFLFIIVGLFLINFTSALEFDNLKTYDPITREATFYNTFLGFKTSEIGKARLNTPLNVKVAVGYQKVAEFDLWAYEDYSDALKQLEFKNMSNGKVVINRDYDLKYRTTKEVRINDYVNVCKKELNGTTICHKEINGFHWEAREDWIKITPANLKKNEVITIGVFTEVKEGDFVDWIPMIYGVPVEEWATWEESLNTELISYYKLDENGANTTVVDALGNNDGTSSINTANLYDASGKINSAFNFNAATPDYINISDSSSFGFTDEITISAWINMDNPSSPAQQKIITKDKSGTEREIVLQVTSTAVHWILWDTGDVIHNYQPSFNFSSSTWYHIAAIYDGSTMRVYVNGTEIESGLSETFNIKDGSRSFIIGTDEILSASAFDGRIDEIGIWERALNESEITNYYNNGNPPYINETEAADNPPTIILNSPEDNINYTVSPLQVNFSCYGSDDINLTSVGLYINGSLDQLNASGINNTNYTFTKTLIEGNYNWTCEGTDNNSQTTKPTERIFKIHTTAPSVTIHYPTGNFEYILISEPFILNWTVEEPGENLTTHIVNCTYNYNGVITEINNTVCTQINQTTFTQIPGVNTLNFTVTDEFGLQNTSTTSWTVRLTEINQTYTTPATEGTPNTITKKLEIVGSVDGAILDYNGTNYTTSINYDGENYTFSSTVVAPLVDVDENITFKLYVIVGGVYYKTTETTQLIQSINLSTCTTGDLLNLFLFDEDEKTELFGTIEVNTQLISKISEETIESVLEEINNTSNLSICLDPISAVGNFYLDVDIVYSADDYAKEFYFIRNAELSAIPINVSLFDLHLNQSTEFLLRYQGQTLTKVEGAVIQLQRYYISSGASETVEAPLTSISGTAVAHIDLNTNKYSAVVVKDGVILDIFNDIVFDCENELSGQCTQNLYADITPYNIIDGANLGDFSYAIADTGSALVTTFSIPSGSTKPINVLMTQRDQFGNTTGCNKTITTSSGSLECTYNKTIGDSYLWLEINKDGENQAEKEYFVPEANGIEWGGLNWLAMFILLISLALMAISSPEWIIGNSVVTFIIGGALWLVAGMNIVAGLGLLLWLLVAAILLILELSKQEDR